MSNRKSILIGIEGSHGAGKTTTALALTAYLKSHHVHAGYLPEVARNSPYIDDIIVRKTRQYDIASELHLFASQIDEEQKYCRNYDVVVCDRTVMTVIGYSNTYLSEATGWNGEILDKMRDFSAVYAQNYGALLYLGDRYEAQMTLDALRPNVGSDRVIIDTAIRKACTDACLPLAELPLGLSTDQRVTWILSNVSCVRQLIK